MEGVDLCCQPRHLRLLLLKLRRALLQGLHRAQQNPRHIAGVNGGLRADLADVVVAEGRKEVLCHRAIVAKRLGIVANEVPAGERQAANLPQHGFSVHRPEVFLLVLSELLVNGTCPSITVTAVLPKRILLLALTRVLKPMAVALTRLPADTSAPYPMAVLSLPVVLFKNLGSAGGVFGARGSVEEREGAAGGVVEARGGAEERLEAVAVLSEPVVFFKSAPYPMAVLSLPMVLFSAGSPLAVL